MMKIEELNTKELLEKTGNTTDLTDREKHLIGLAVTTTRGCIACTGRRMKKAIENEVPYKTLVAAIDLSAAVNAGVTAAIAIQGAQRENLEDCNDGACTIGVSN